MFPEQYMGKKELQVFSRFLYLLPQCSLVILFKEFHPIEIKSSSERINSPQLLGFFGRNTF